MKKIEVLFSDYCNENIQHPEAETAGQILSDTLEKLLKCKELRAEIEDATSRYAAQSEKQGYIEGFKCAMQIMKECE